MNQITLFWCCVVIVLTSQTANSNELKFQQLTPRDRYFVLMLASEYGLEFRSILPKSQSGGFVPEALQKRDVTLRRRPPAQEEPTR